MAGVFDAASLKAAIASAPVDKPSQVASPSLPALAAVGRELAIYTMAMIAVGAAIILILIGVSEYSGQSTAATALDRQAKAISSLSLQQPDPELRALAGLIARNAEDPRVILPSNATILLDRVSTSGIADIAQIKVLDQCKVPPADPKARTAALRACAETLTALTAADSAATQKIGFMTKMQDSVATDRAATRAFWMQVAQLVLINMLLPILTALLGYIFGTQRAAG